MGLFNRDSHGLDLPRGERVLAWARATDGSVVAGSRDALHARSDDGTTLRSRDGHDLRGEAEQIQSTAPAVEPRVVYQPVEVQQVMARFKRTGCVAISGRDARIMYSVVEDMMLAVERHPAMLVYLDQAVSVGPNSVLGRRAALRRGPNAKRRLGLNENLAREILELHTLGVRTGYTQADVTEFARAMTGWTVAGIGGGPLARQLEGFGTPGQFVFAEPRLSSFTCHRSSLAALPGRR